MPCYRSPFRLKGYDGGTRNGRTCADTRANVLRKCPPRATALILTPTTGWEAVSAFRFIRIARPRQLRKSLPAQFLPIRPPPENPGKNLCFCRPSSPVRAFVKDWLDGRLTAEPPDSAAGPDGVHSMGEQAKTTNSCVDQSHPRHVVPIGVVLAGLVLSVALFVLLRSSEYRFAQRQFEQSSQDHCLALRYTLETDFSLIKSLRAFYVASEQVTGKEFCAFAASAIGKHPGILAVQWAPGTDPSQPAARFPILLSEPHDGKAAAVGSDLAADPVCREAIGRACDLGEPVLTDRLPLAAEPGNRREVRLFVAIYQKNVAHDTVERRRKRLRGFVVGVFSPRQVVEDALGTLMPAGIDVWLADSTDPIAEHSLYFHRSRMRPPDSDPSTLSIDAGANGFCWRETLDAAGRRWTVTCVAVPQFVAARTTWYPWGAAAAGLLMTALLAAYLAGIANRDARTRQLATQLTETHRRLEQETPSGNKRNRRCWQARRSTGPSTNYRATPSCC